MATFGNFDRETLILEGENRERDQKKVATGY